MGYARLKRVTWKYYGFLNVKVTDVKTIGIQVCSHLDQ